MIVINLIPIFIKPSKMAICMYNSNAKKRSAENTPPKCISSQLKILSNKGKIPFPFDFTIDPNSLIKYEIQVQEYKK